jgi:hypothetical protein
MELAQELLIAIQKAPSRLEADLRCGLQIYLFGLLSSLFKNAPWKGRWGGYSISGYYTVFLSLLFSLIYDTWPVAI